MDSSRFWFLLAVMAITTYLVRALPFAIFQGKIKNKRVQAFFDYIPYSVLSAMTFPAILYSTGSFPAAAAGFVVALILSLKGKSLLTVAIGTCLTTFLVSFALTLV